MTFRLYGISLALALGAPGCSSSPADDPQIGSKESALSSGFATTPTTTQAYPLLPRDWTLFRFKLVDFNGDGTPDLVQESPGGPPGGLSPPAFGASALDAHWNVWFNTGGTFATTPSEFAVPDLTFGQMTGTHWDTFDIDGDGLIDLVETADRAVVGTGPQQKRVFGASAGAPFWKVYHGTGVGFAKTPVIWPVPIITDPNGLFRREVGNESYGADWQTRDMNGDGRDDVVITGKARAALATWLIYYNTGTGFDPAATPWSFPPDALARPRVLWRWNAGASDYLEDADGDGRPDWIRLSVSGHVFNVSRNNGAGFDPAVAWSMPSVPTCNRLHSEGYSFTDVDGDGRVDLVSPANSCADVVWNWAEPFWKVYRNTGTNFDLTLSQHAVPNAPGSGISRIHSGDLDHGHWTTMDFDGDGVPDLAVFVVDSAGHVELRLYRGQ